MRRCRTARSSRTRSCSRWASSRTPTPSYAEVEAALAVDPRVRAAAVVLRTWRRDRDLVRVWQKMNTPRFDNIMLKTKTVGAEALGQRLRPLLSITLLLSPAM